MAGRLMPPQVRSCWCVGWSSPITAWSPVNSRRAGADSVLGLLIARLDGPLRSALVTGVPSYVFRRFDRCHRHPVQR